MALPSSPFSCKIKPFSSDQESFDKEFSEFRKLCHDVKFDRRTDYIDYVFVRLNQFGFNQEDMSKHVIMGENGEIVRPDNKDYDFVSELIIRKYTNIVEHQIRLFALFMQSEEKDDGGFKISVDGNWGYFPKDMCIWCYKPENKKHLDMVIDKLEEYERAQYKKSD